SETFATADGEIAVAVGSERQWQRFCEAIGRPELATDPRFDTNAQRVSNRQELRPALERAFSERGSFAWLDALDAAGVPCGPIRNIAETFADPQVQARRMIETIAHPTVGTLRTTGIPFKFSRTPGSVRSAPPLRGQHAEEVLGWLGYTDPEIATLRAGGAAAPQAD
ncbi:MAG: CoA transferase, partial [Chloroflexi bacterium]|nr:CoA transferase [Chloroflexota bacterium]